MKSIFSLLFVSVILLTVSAASAEEGSSVKFRGLKSVDTLNITHAKFSPFNGEDKERHGENVNIKARIRPARIGALDVGGYVTYTEGSGDTYTRSNGRWSHTDYTTIGGGISGVYHHDKYRQSEAELGILYQETENSSPARNNFRSWQDEYQIEARLRHSDETRRGAGEKFLPFWEVGAHYIHPFDVSYHDSRGGHNPYDNRRLRAFGLVDLYDWYLDDAGKWRITPTLNAELGYIWGKDSGYLQGGLGTKLAWHEQELIDIKVLNPRWMFEGDGSRLYNHIATVKIDNIIRAAWASRTATYVAEKQ